MGHVRICDRCDTYYDNDDKCMCDKTSDIEEGGIFTEDRIRFSYTYRNPEYVNCGRGPIYINRVYDYSKITNYCPFCSKDNVWKSNTNIDHYVGAKHLCASCCSKFYLPSPGYEMNRGDIKVVAEINKLGG
jgi:hypothetical protein